MHDHNGENNKSMIWMMIPCLLLIAFTLFGVGSLVSSKYLWLIIVGVCLVLHIWMMFKGHGGHNNTNAGEKSDTTAEEKDNKHGGSCCH